MTLDENNITDYAVAHYLPIGMSYDDLNTDLQRLALVGASLKRFSPGKSPRLLINQLITVFNTFEPEAAVRLLLIKTERKLYPRLKAVLMVFGVWFDGVHAGNIEVDVALLDAVREDLNEWRRTPCQQ